jgi:hypothetical protein
MDVIKADAAWLDYNFESPTRTCTCQQHAQAWAPYVRCEPVFAEMTAYKQQALRGELGPALRDLAIIHERRRRGRSRAT